MLRDAQRTATRGCAAAFRGGGFVDAGIADGLTAILAGIVIAKLRSENTPEW